MGAESPSRSAKRWRRPTRSTCVTHRRNFYRLRWRVPACSAGCAPICSHPRPTSRSPLSASPLLSGSCRPCCAFVRVWSSYFVYGFYPISERWRVDLFFVLLALGITWLAWLGAPRRDLGAIYFFIVLPILSYILLSGVPMIGLPDVPTSLWGGILVTIVVATVGIVASLPLGILLALGRRSAMPAVRLASITFIEFVRGVPL